MKQERPDLGKCTQQCRTLLVPHIDYGDRVVDATAGNGQDTLWMAKRVGDAGRVWAFDIQERALKLTQKLLEAHSMSHRAELLHATHADLREHLQAEQGKLALIMFNLGYLPGGNRSVVTVWPSTVIALEQSLDLLRPGGILSVLAYSGHEEGFRESTELEAFCEGLDPKQAVCASYRLLNRSSSAPRLFLLQRTSR